MNTEGLWDLSQRRASEVEKRLIVEVGNTETNTRVGNVTNLPCDTAAA